MARFPGFVGGSYQSSSINADAERSINLFPEQIEPEFHNALTPARFILLGSPGLQTFATLPTSPVRGILSAGTPIFGAPRCFVVGGSKLYEIASDGSIVTGVARGDVGTDATNTPAQIFANGNQLWIVSAGKSYCDNGLGPVLSVFPNAAGVVSTNGTAVTLVSGTDFSDLAVGSAIVINSVGYTVALLGQDATTLTLTATAGVQTSVAYSATLIVNAGTGAYVDGYFIANKPSSKQFNISPLNNGVAWNALDFAVKLGYPDNVARVFSDHRDLWLFGEETTEVWRDTGGSSANTFPFERDPSGFIQQGIGAIYSVASLANGVCWIGGDSRGMPVAWRAQGFQPTRISTHAVELAWASYPTVADANAYAYTDNGHQFWVINFLQGAATWVYDAVTGLWHERGWWNGASNVQQLGRCHAYCFGKHLVGDRLSGKVYWMHLAFYDDAGTAIHRLRAAPHQSEEDNRTFYARFRLEMENTGTINPSLDWSNDGGHTFDTPRTTTSNTAGALARYDWRRCGAARDRVFRVQTSAAVKIAMLGADLEMTNGTK
ncbi:MAG: hypothetical protein NVSMB64_06220 [Candidatus Velthaea sp.]